MYLHSKLESFLLVMDSLVVNFFFGRKKYFWASVAVPFSDSLMLDGTHPLFQDPMQDQMQCCNASFNHSSHVYTKAFSCTLKAAKSAKSIY